MRRGVPMTLSTTVVAVERLGPSWVRVVVSGEDLRGFGVGEFTDHYVKHPVVLARLARLQHDQLRDLLAAGRECVLSDARRKKARLRQDKGHDIRK